MLTAAAVFHAGMNSLKTRLKNDVTIYGEHQAVTEISNVAMAYSSLWVDQENVVDISKLKWMDILLLDDWRDKYKSGQARVYPLGVNDCA